MKRKLLNEKYPELLDYFEDINDAKIPCYSVKEVKVVCPFCNSHYSITPRKLIQNKSHGCIICSDGFPYPEKMMMNVLNALSITYIHQYTDTWTEKYRYDFKFELNDNKIIIEMDGGIGHGHKTFENTSIDESIEIDAIKDDLARKNGFKIFRVDCNYENKDRYTYIKNNIINTLSPIIDFSFVDFDECNKLSLNSKFREVIDFYNRQSVFINEISNITNIKTRTVKKYLSYAMNEGLLNRETLYYDRQIKQKHITSDGEKIGKKLYCYNDKRYFNSIKSCAIYYSLNEQSLRLALKKNGIVRHKGYYFSLIENIDENIDLSKYELKSDHIYQYSLDGELIAVYHGKKDLPNEYLYTSIVKGCTGERKTVYGYKWSYEKLTA